MRAAAILTGPPTHLDHLGVLSALIEIPLIVTDEATFEQAKTYYPKIDVRFLEMRALSIDFLAHEFDLIFETGKFWRIDLKPFIELLFRKTIRFVFCPHGNSDKGHSLKDHPEQDISLVYGDHLFDHLKKTGALEKIGKVVYTGNYRLPFYLENKEFYDQLAQTQVFSRFHCKKPIILYAPTWQDRENPTSFFSATEEVIEQLGADFNLVIKLHPFLFERHLGKVLHILQRYETHPSTLFLNDFPPIYPLLAGCDLYLGDYSSIGYDFLAFDKPLYFFNPSTESVSSSLHSCGITIPSARKKELRAFFHETWEHSRTHFSSLRRETYAYTFGKEKDPKELRAEIFAAALNPAGHHLDDQPGFKR